MASELELEEQFDTLDPLRHLRNGGELGLVPAQPPSIHNEDLQLAFPSAGGRVPNPVSIRLLTDASPGCGGITWLAGEILSAYVCRRGSLKGKNVLELGSGTGLVGLVTGVLGAQVWITDQAPLLGIMAHNVEINNLSHRVSVMELNWGESLPSDLPRFDIILAADCVYFEPAFPLLVQTLDKLAARGDPEILFCYKKRRKADKRFFTMLKKKFNWTEVDDDPNKEQYNRDAVSLFRPAIEISIASCHK
ncbi:uncharacterized protein PHACADRAFT_191971 [Phanerochaete carnosa HHB-10118-sp]|uniref:Protein-lysine N-methyltransferase EFM6 n=1 Tax=Phanerochaete carnosa (strain HHB-10118-sp) TaxID=650164 RepID=K5WJK8_PHACS|nr:uncharacterized protein PHACADRAFT_191971 [Phanerochaete carnosa HHB-10118-sp]EKM59600.1 hypothetical protein PHACADRAFT_191971 [Phanerochaete carnosa HHB-10118-sp]